MPPDIECPTTIGSAIVEAFDQLVDLRGDVLEVARWAGAGAVGGQVDRDRADPLVEPVDDRPPAAAAKGETGEQHDRHAAAAALEGEAGLLWRGGHRRLFFLSSLFRYAVT